MKKKLLLFVMIMVALMALSIFASATELDTNDLTAIKDAITNATEGETITINMTGDVLVPSTSSAIKLEKGVTLVINTNGHTLYTNPGSASAGSAYGILLNSGYAKLVINGESSVDFANYIAPKDEKLTVSNGEIIDPNDATGVKSPDFASNGPGILLKSGSIEINNVYLRQYHSDEWAIYCSPNGNADKLVTNVSVTNSIIRQPDGCGYGALGARGGSYNIYESCLQIEDSVIYGLGNQYWSVSEGSYVKNSRFLGSSVVFDGYVKSSYEKGTSFDAPVVLENVIFENPSFGVTSGTAHIRLIDCQFPNGMAIYVSKDSNGPGSISMVKSATCTEAGRLVYVKAVTSTSLTSMDDFPNEDEQYALDNPALGHARCGSHITISYKDGFASAGYYDFNCSRCTKQYTESIPCAPAIFSALGYSYKEDSINGGGIAGGFAINNPALSDYETLTGDEVSFGVVIFNPDLATGDTFFTDGALTIKNGGVQASIQDMSYAGVSYAVTGFMGESAELDLVISAYAYSSVNELEFIQKQYAQGENSTKAYAFEKTDGTLYSVNCTTVKNADPDYVVPSSDEE